MEEPTGLKRREPISMVAELISVGTELLLGNIVNTNASFLAEECAALGLSVYYQTTVGDNEERLFQTVQTACDRSDIIILSGGLGPTQDDLTKEVCAKAAGLNLVEDPHTKERIEAYFEKLAWDMVPENNWKQAMIPEGAIVMDNDNGTAPGLIIEMGEKSFILLPGPPDELIPMFQEKIVLYLKQRQPEIIYSKMIKICGMGESMVETMVKDLIDKQSNPTIATYAKIGEVHLRITAKARDEEEAKLLLRPMVKELKRRFGTNVYSTKEAETLEDSIVKLLKKHSLTLTTAESCTGGLLAGRIVNVSGVSEVFKQGFITYSNKAKRKVLDVRKSTLKKYGAVSEKTAKEMVKGAIFVTDAEAGLAITGIAGPDGGSEEKPVGLVYISCYMKDKAVVHEYHLKGNRAKIRQQSVVRALTLLRKCIIEEHGL